jgi:hypothetical protein
VLTANGHLEPDIDRVQPANSTGSPPNCFWNRGESKATVSFRSAREMRHRFVQAHRRPRSAFADIDDDGDLDVVLAQVAGPPLLLRNDQLLGHHGFV